VLEVFLTISSGLEGKVGGAGDCCSREARGVVVSGKRDRMDEGGICCFSYTARDAAVRYEREECLDAEGGVF